MKVKHILFLIVASLCLVSCGEKIAYSDHIQDTFFGVKFGANQEKVKRSFEQHNLYSNEYSTASQLQFESSSEYFDFGVFDWDFVNVYFNNNKFYCIPFGYTHGNKVTALERFESVFDALSAKYKMNERPIQDTNTYRCYSARTKDGKGMVIGCDKGKV